MDPKRPLTKPVALFVVLTIIGLALFLVVANFRPSDPGSVSITRFSSSVMTSSISPIPDEIQTIAAIVTINAIGEATYFATTRTSITPIYLPTGIYDDQRVKISAALLFIDAQNAWGGFLDGNRFSLYAGSLQSDSEQGVVGMVTNIPGGKKIEQFTTPSKHGAVRVLGESNNRITLSAFDGTIFYFDLTTHQFMMNLTETVPVTTP